MLDDDNIEILDDDNNTSSSNFNNVGNNINNKDSKNLKDKVEQGKTNNQSNRNANSQMPVGGPNNGNQFKNSGNLAKISGAAGAINSDDPNAQAQALKNAGKEVIKPIVRKGVQAATGGAVGSGPVTSKIIDKAVDKVADDPKVDKIIEDVTKKVNKAKKKLILSLVMSVAPTFITIILIVAVFTSPMALAGEVSKNVGNFFKSVGNWLIGNDYCANDAECQTKYANKYYTAIQDFGEEYNSVCNNEWNSDLISATIFYEQMVLMDKVDIEDEEEDDDDSDSDKGYSESINSLYNYKNANKKVKKLTKKLYPDFEDTSATTTQRCAADYNGYGKYLSTYVDKNFKEFKKEENKEYTNEVVVEEIMAFGNQTIIANAYKGSYYCQGVTVFDSDNNLIGTYDLETYVAGVVAGESYTQYGIEALKAQAIAARTFLLKTTNNCKAPIQSGQNRQVFKETTDDKAIQAAKETEGLVLQYDSELISAQYDSFCYGDSDCPDSSCNDTECSVTYTKLPNEEKHVIKIPIKWKSLFVPGGGHARGMSQLAAYDMAEKGSLYDQILYTFYSPGVEIVAMGGLISGANFTSSIEPPLNADAIKERTKNGDQFYNSSKGLISQCPWYAKSRASEILYYSNIPDNVKDAAIKSITNTGGNGADVVNNIDETLFQKSYDYTQPHPGAVVSWKSSAKDGASCHNYGHVAIVEQVKEDGTILISEGWNGGGTEAANVWSNIRYSLREVSLDYMSGYTNSRGCRYTFNGYAYLLG